MGRTYLFGPLAVVPRISAVLFTHSAIVPRAVLSNPLASRGRPPSVWRTHFSTLEPGVYTFPDLMRNPPHQQLAARNGQRHTSEDMSTQSNEQTKSKESRKKQPRGIDENLKSTSQQVSGMAQTVEIRLLKWSPKSHLLSHEVIKYRAITNFLRGYLGNLFDQVAFSGYYGLLYFVWTYDPEFPLSVQNLCMMRGRPPRFRHVPKTKASMGFISYVKRHFPRFDEDQFYALSGTYVRYGTIQLVRPNQDGEAHRQTFRSIEADGVYQGPG